MSSREDVPSDKKELDLKTDFAEIMAAGHSIHLWNTGGSVRVAEILRAGDRMGIPEVPKLGYGADATATEALRRALDSYTQREAEGKDQMTPEDIKAADAGYATGGQIDGSYLDAVAARNEISFYFANGRVMAEIPTAFFGVGRRAYGSGEDMQAAIDDLERISSGRIY
jgi:hypothetical protein